MCPRLPQGTFGDFPNLYTANMSESTNLISSPCQSTKSLPISFHQQLVLIYQNFRNLKTKYEYDDYYLNSNKTPMVRNFNS
ncbi:hypothetical protein PCANC_14664 [Puccinia coronata f. sp. avenae]|uniref:Uncharacterized protein n=1 Tax=Puccinia coronata f. sp. avenae TaxID=200324 RepID=A0A2N5SVZ6_9BASI|nr:hypothetical protein PCANC_14664 [Puccinia coronata f. sp. avenae]